MKIKRKAFALLIACCTPTIAILIYLSNKSNTQTYVTKQTFTSSQADLAKPTARALPNSILLEDKKIKDKNQPKGLNSPVNESLESKYVELNSNEEYPSLDYRIAEIDARRGKQNTLTPESIIQHMASNTAWETQDEPSENLPITDDERYDGREFIRFNPLKVETLVAGDTLTIPIFQTNREYIMKVTEVEVHDDGNITWSGFLEGFNDSNQVSITKGETLTVAGITTPEGHFTLEARENNGWIVNSNTLFKRDPNQPDMLFPDDSEEGQHHHM